MRLRVMDLIVHYSYLPTYLSLIIPENQTPIDLPIFPFSLIVSRHPPHDHPLAPCPP